MSSVRAATCGYGSGRMGALAYLILHGYQGSGPGPLADVAGRAPARRPARPSRYPDLPDAGRTRSWRAWLRGARAASWTRSASRRSWSATRSPACCGCTTCAARRARRPSGCCSSRRRRAPARRTPLALVLPGPPTRRDRSARTRGSVCSRRRPVLPGGRGRSSTARRSAAGRPARRAPGHVNPDAGYGPWPGRRGVVRDGRAAQARCTQLADRARVAVREPARACRRRARACASTPSLSSSAREGLARRGRGSTRRGSPASR